MSAPIRVLGVISGMSCDALEAACIEIDAEGWSPLWSASCPYPKALREAILKFQRPKARQSSQERLALSQRLGDWSGEAIRKLIAKNEKPDLISNHGQTLPVGDPARIACATGLSVASNFRDGDLAAGGRGAPLVPLFHRLIAGGLAPEGGIAIHEIGKISNATYIGRDQSLLTFETGPARGPLAESIASAYKAKLLKKRLPLSAVYLYGEGAAKPEILNGLAERLPGVAIRTLAETGLDTQRLQAQAFAFYGFISLLGQPLGGTWTGAKGFGPPAHIIPGENWRELLKKLETLL